MITSSIEIADLNAYHYELGPIRPPSEAFSLLIRVTRNCSWNKCAFCRVYPGQRFELRPAEDVIRDIESAKAIRDGITELAWKAGRGDRIRHVAAEVYNQPHYNECVRNVALWLYGGGQSAFLQDANTLIMRTPDLVKVVSFLKSSFPSLDRITSYARSKTAAKKTVEELKALREAGLSRLHIGMESGSDMVLAYVNKGVTADDHIKGGRNVKAAAIELSEYFMPGLGGKTMSKDHVAGTARVLNAIDPDFIRLRSLQVFTGTGLDSRVASGDFQLLTEDEVVAEIEQLIEKLEITGMLKSDHVWNLLPELDGKFPEAKAACLEVIHRYLSLPPDERLNFRLGRRAGFYERLADLDNPAMRQRVGELIRSIGAKTPEDFEKAISQLKSRFL
jgi:hypothetical protein